MVILLVLAFGLLLASSVPVGAQESDIIEYPENGTEPVAVFTAEDPEDAGAISWSLRDNDFEDFEIGESSGVLTFAEVPDHEMPADGNNNNVYMVTVVATDAEGMESTEEVTIRVTNVDEAGTVTLSAVAPYPGVELTTGHTDLDGQIARPEWQWSKSRARGGPYTEIAANAEGANYTPTSRDVGFYLRATVTYNDGQGEGKSAMATSAHTVQSINEPNASPAFPDDEDGMRAVEENTPAGEDVGLPVAAGDDDNDILTYTLTDVDGGNDGDSASFDIEAATGQIKTKGELDTETAPTYEVKVTATDPAGDSAQITVTITVSGVNEAPEITAADVSYDESTTGMPNEAVVANFSARDPEGAGTVALDLNGTDASLFTLNEDNELTFNDPPNYESPDDANEDNTYELTVGARDADGIRSTKDIEVKVTNVNEPGTVTLSAVQPRVGVPVTARLTDIDGPVSGVTWQWSDGANNYADATSDTYTPTTDNIGHTLTATATYTDPHGSMKTAVGDSGSNPVAADTRNKPPAFRDADGTQITSVTREVREDAAADASLDGGAVTATDPNADDRVSYTLGGTDASSFDIGLTSGLITVGQGTRLDYEDVPSYMVAVTATDSFGASASIDVTINVIDVNEGPEITGPDRVDAYPENGTEPVAVFTAEDPEDAGAISWSLRDNDFEDFEIGESSGVLTFAEVPDHEMPADGNNNNVYMVTVVATDAEGMESTEEVTIRVTNVDEAGTVTLSAVAPYPGVELTTGHTDLDGQIARPEWQWSKSRARGGPYTDIAANAEGANYTPTSRDVGFYLRATVTYNDGQGEGKSAMATSAHTVQSINEPNASPAFPDDEDGMRAVEENTPAGEDVGLPVAAGDDDNDILTYTLTDVDGGNDGDSASFDIEAATGQIKTKGELDTETAPTYEVKVTATDPAGDSAQITVTITVSGVNEAPEITAADVSYDESTTGMPNEAVVANFSARDPEGAGTVALDLNGTDASLFTLNEDNELTFNDPPNYESPDDANEDNTYELTVGARDADGIRSTKDIEVKVTNVNEPGTVTLSAVQPRVGVPVTARLTDIDGPVSGVTWQWSDGANNYADATSDTYTPTTDNIGHTLTATATYTDPHGSMKTAVGDSGSNPVAADTRNKPPAFRDADGTQITSVTREVREDAAADASLDGGAVTATDPNADDRVSYTLGGTDASSFDIGLTSGLITVGQGTRLDYEDVPSYMVAVTATDSFGASASIDVTINVIDVNEGPEITRGGLAISGPSAKDYAENGTANVGIFNAAGSNAASATWSLSGADAGDFRISNSGVLTFETSPDFEAPADADRDNVYMVTVEADDGTYYDTHDVTVTVTNVNEDGVVTLTTQSPAVGTAITADLTDPDGVVSGSESWQWAREQDDSSYSDIAGATSASYTPGNDDSGKHLRVTVKYDDGEGTGKSLSTITDDLVVIGDPLLVKYDADDNGRIDKAELAAGVYDYEIGGTISKDDLAALVFSYEIG